MTKLSIKLSEREYKLLTDKKGKKSHRQAYLEAMGIKPDKKKIGRPRTRKIIKTRTLYVHKNHRDIYEQVMEFANNENQNFSELVFIALKEYLNSEFRARARKDERGGETE